jgi:RimJ/RimL family protein N-acetyltransferase
LDSWFSRQARCFNYGEVIDIVNRKMVSDLVYLRSLELDDLDRIYNWHNDPALYETLVGAFRPVSRAAAEEWLREKIAYSAQEENLAICLKDNSQHIGNIYLRNIDWVARHAETGILIGDPGQRGKGCGTMARRLQIEHAFQDLGLQRLYATVLADNKAVVRMNEKCGFVVEGRLRRHIFKDGKFRDALILGICADDYFSSKGT